MSARPIQPRQRGAIHAIRKAINLDEGSYRALLQGFGVGSSSDLDEAGADAVIARLRAIEGSATASGGAQLWKAEGPYAGKLQSLWLSLHNLGAVQDGRITALHAFMKRQCGVEHTRFLRSDADARPVIEALKKMLAREGVRATASTGSRRQDLLLMKREILRAQWIRGCALGAIQALGRPEDCDGLAEYASAILRGGGRRLSSIEDPSLEPAELDKVAAALGRKIRAALKANGGAHV